MNAVQVIPAPTLLNVKTQMEVIFVCVIMDTQEMVIAAQVNDFVTEFLFILFMGKTHNLYKVDGKYLNDIARMGQGFNNGVTIL